MDLHHLRYFIAVAELLSFRRTAEHLHLSRPPLTRQIKALEREVGVLLLVRDGRQAVRLTEAGHAFLKHAKQALQKVQAAGDHARRAAQGADGVLRLVGCTTYSPVALNVYLPEFRRRYPAVEVTFMAATRAEELTWLREGRGLHVLGEHGAGATFPRHGLVRPGVQGRLAPPARVQPAATPDLCTLHVDGGRPRFV